MAVKSKNRGVKKRKRKDRIREKTVEKTWRRQRLSVALFGASLILLPKGCSSSRTCVYSTPTCCVAGNHLYMCLYVFVHTLHQDMGMSLCMHTSVCHSVCTRCWLYSSLQTTRESCGLELVRRRRTLWPKHEGRLWDSEADSVQVPLGTVSTCWQP